MKCLKKSILLLICSIIPAISFSQISFDQAYYPFLGSNYVAGTLEQGIEEPLTINLEEVDCNTFVDYVYSAMISGSDPCADDILFTHTVESIRYRNGLRNGYMSRLHYFTEWIEQQKNNNKIFDVVLGDGMVANTKSIDFMSEHSHLYPILKANPYLVDSIKGIEENISTFEWSYIPLDKISEITPLLKKGDIIAIVTNTKGLDISHVGFAIPFDGQFHLLHASSISKKVIIDPAPLEEYLRRNSKNIGIRVLRLKPYDEQSLNKTLILTKTLPLIKI